MYNRYFRNDQGTYERVRVPQRDHPRSPSDEPHREPFMPSDASPPPHDTPPLEQENHCDPHRPSFAEYPHGGPHEPSIDHSGHGGAHDSPRFLGRVLEKLKLQDVDTGDILLLLILFFLFEEKADDELLIALGLLLIL